MFKSLSKRWNDLESFYVYTYVDKYTQEETARYALEFVAASFENMKPNNGETETQYKARVLAFCADIAKEALQYA